MGAWSRKGLKEKAKIRLKANYWKAVLVGLLAVLIGGGGSAASGRRHFTHLGEIL